MVSITASPTGTIGKSAYQSWLDTGHVGTEADFVAGLKGAQGDAGATGAKGDTGAAGSPGATGAAGATGPQGAKGDTGAQGQKGYTGATGPSGATFLTNVTFGQTAAVIIAAGVRSLTVTGVTGLLAGDRILLTPTADLPAGYGLHDAIATSAGTMVIRFTGPVLAVGASFSITAKVTVFR